MIGEVPHCVIVRGVRNRPIDPRANRLISRFVITALCLTALLWSATSASRTLVLVSIDGFRWDYLDWPEAGQLKAIAEQGITRHQPARFIPPKLSPAICRWRRVCIPLAMALSITIFAVMIARTVTTWD